MEQPIIYAEQLGTRHARIDFRGGFTDVAAILGQLAVDLGKCLPNFVREGGTKTHLLRGDLRALREPVLLVFDSYDDDVAGNRPLADWLSYNLLSEVGTARAMAVIVAGRRRPVLDGKTWRDLARLLPFRPITSLQDWEPWVQRRFPTFQESGAHLPTVLMAVGGHPALVSLLVRDDRQDSTPLSHEQFLVHRLEKLPWRPACPGRIDGGRDRQRAEPNPERVRVTVDAAAVLRSFDASSLSATSGITANEAHASFELLTRMPFVQRCARGQQQVWRIQETVRLGCRRSLASERRALSRFLRSSRSVLRGRPEHSQRQSIASTIASALTPRARRPS